MKIPPNATHEGKSIKNRETGMSQNMSQSMKKHRKSRGRNLLAGVSAAAVATGLGSTDARAEDVDRHRLEIGLGISRLQIEAPNETFEPFWADDWDDIRYAPPIFVPNKDPDSGFNGELWVTFRPRNSSWTVSGGARAGSAGVSVDFHQTEKAEDLPEIPAYIGSSNTEGPVRPEFTSGRAERHEEFTIVDFEVGKDVGLGFLGEGGESHVAFGLRYAQFKSNTTDVVMDGMPNRYDPEALSYEDFIGTIISGGNPFKYHNTDVFEADFESRREFEGWGPSASWMASKRLFGNDRAGYVALDWALGGGVLFGKQETEVEYRTSSRYYSWPVFPGVCGPTGCASGSPPAGEGDGNPQNEELDEASHDRDDDVTVPFVDLDLGVSYKLERLRVSLGYQLKEYFGAIDGGVDERKVYDRTFHGPYFRVSVGFGDGGE